MRTVHERFGWLFRVPNPSLPSLTSVLTLSVNTARGKICDRDAIARALESGQLAGYAGDVWFPQPAPADHPWRTMPHNGMTPHISGTSLSAQTRYAAGTREILECWFEDRPIRGNEYLITKGGKLARTGAHSYSVRETAKA
jgi:formate dehydrogenase